MELLLALFLTKSLATNLTIQSIDSVDWDTDFSWSSKLGEGEKIEMSIDFTCYVNYNSFPLRIHCTGDLGVGYEENLDAKMTVQFGTEIRWEQLENIETTPEVDFYFAFTSPEVSWDWADLGSITYIHSEAFPSKDGYYVKTVPLEESIVVRQGKSWDISVCATEFGDLIPNSAAVASVELAAIKAVAESGEYSGSDLCITMVVSPAGKKTVELDLLAEVYALDETRIDWDNIPESLEVSYGLVQCPSIDDWKFKNKCATPEGTFEYLRELITGMDSGYHNEIDIPSLISEFLVEQKEIWEQVSDLNTSDPDYRRWVKTTQNAGPLITHTGSIRLGPLEEDILSLGEILAIGISATVILGFITWMIWIWKTGRKFSNPIYCCNAAEKDESVPQGHVARMRANYEGAYKEPLIASTAYCKENPGIQAGNVARTVKLFEEKKLDYNSGR